MKLNDLIEQKYGMEQKQFDNTLREVNSFNS